MKTDAFEQQASRLRSIAFGASANAGADVDTAEDIAQETMIRLWQMRDDPRLCNPDGYATMIARHLTLNQLRRQRPLSVDERHYDDPTTPSPLDLMIQREEEEWLRQRIRDLPTTLHAGLHMRQVEHRTNGQIASLLGMKESSVSTLLARARRQLLEEIRQYKNERQ